MIMVIHDIITYGDVAPTLERRYGIVLHEDARAFISQLEWRFLERILAEADDPTLVLLGPEYFTRLITRLSTSGCPVYVLDDIYLATQGGPFHPFSVNRVFEAFPLGEPILRSRLNELTGQPLKSCVPPTRRADGGLVHLLADGLFTGGTMKAACEKLETQGAQVGRAYAVIARDRAVEQLRALWGQRVDLSILGATFSGGWDHCRDLLGVHGLKVGETGFVPYWNIPEWISLETVDRGKLVRICKTFFEELERFAARYLGLVFARRRLHLVPYRLDSEQGSGASRSRK